DRRGAAERLEAVQFDAAPLEAALLQNVARRRVGDARTGKQVIAVEFLEEVIDRGPRGFGGKTPAPMLDAEPVADFRRLGFEHVEADHADRRKIMLDQKPDLTRLGRG